MPARFRASLAAAPARGRPPPASTPRVDVRRRFKPGASRADGMVMHPAPASHVRGALVRPAIDWLGQLVASQSDEGVGLDVLSRSDTALMLGRPAADAWVPAEATGDVLDTLLAVHGGRASDVLRELGRRTAPQVTELAGDPDRVALRLARLARLGRWRKAAPLLPGDLVELQASVAPSPTLLAWVAGLLDGALHGGTRPSRISQIEVRRESPWQCVFVRCRR